MIAGGIGRRWVLFMQNQGREEKSDQPQHALASD